MSDREIGCFLGKKLATHGSEPSPTGAVAPIGCGRAALRTHGAPLCFPRPGVRRPLAVVRFLHFTRRLGHPFNSRN